MAGLEAKVKWFDIPDGIEDDGVNVGWFEDQRYNDGTSVAQVARWNEYGTKQGVPQRPFVRRTVMKHREEWIEKMRTMVQREMDKKKGVNIDRALKQFGEIVKGDIQMTILEGGFEKNAPSTIRRKGAGLPPLIDTGVMISSIQARTDKELLDV